MVRSSRLRLVLVPVLLAPGLAAGCAYHAGDEAARNWDKWVQQHPLVGARVTDTAGTNVQPFQGAFEAYARLTAAPGPQTIEKAMASMCAFNSETSSRTTYWLQIDRVTLQAPCSDEGRSKISAFWTDVHDLAGIEDLAFSAHGVALTADEAALPALVPQLSKAADATGLAARSSTNTYAGGHTTITQPRSRDLARELALTGHTLDVIGPAVLKIEVLPGRVSVATSGSVAQATGWQQQIGAGDPVLTVTPRRVITEVAYTARARGLVDRLATATGVLAVSTIKPFWAVTVTTSKDARALVRSLDHEPATADLGRLTVQVGKEQRNSATGVGRTCFVRPVFPESNGRAAALLDLCDQAGMVEVDDRFETLDLRIKGPDLKGMLACLFRLPHGQQVYLQLQDGTIEFTTGASLKTQYPASPLAKQLSTLWATLH